MSDNLYQNGCIKFFFRRLIGFPILVGVLIFTSFNVVVTARSLTPGEVTRVRFAGAPDGGYKLYLPEEYEEKEKWPVLIHYHGQGGSANVSIRRAAGDNAFIIVGMTYHDKNKYGGMFPEEVASFKNVVKDLRERVKMDPDRIIVSGTSKGGWHVDLFLRRVGPPIIDGAVIIAAGMDSDHGVLTAEAVAGMPIYIGTGETDVNRTPGHRAKAYFSERNAIVTHEIYEGMGHGKNFQASKLKTWLKLRAGLKNNQKKINRWFRKELISLKQMSTPLENARKFLDIKQDPRFRYLSTAAQKKWKSVKKQLMSEEPIRASTRAVKMMNRAEKLRVEAEYVNSELKTKENRRKAARMYKQIAGQLKQTELAEKARKKFQKVIEKLQVNNF